LFYHLINKPTKPSKETMAKSDVDGKRKGLILAFNATAALNRDEAAVTIVKNTANSGRSGFSATYAYPPPIENVRIVVTCQQ